MNDWPKCANVNHNEQKIIGFCFQPMCKSKQRLLCINCLKQTIHDDHKNDIIECDRLSEWLSQQQKLSSDFLNMLNSCLDNIQQPFKKIQKIMENQLLELSDDDFKNLGYTNLNDTIRNQVLVRTSMVKFLQCKFQQMFESFSKILHSLGELMSEQSMTNSVYQKRLNSLLIPFSNTLEKNSINKDQSIGNFFQTENNLQGLNINNQTLESLQEPQQTPLEFLFHFQNQMMNAQVDLKRDISVNDGIENLILQDYEKAQSIFKTLSQQKPDQESVIWLAYCQYLQKKYLEAINTLKPLGSLQENRQNPQIWYISMMSVIGLQNYNDALYCIQKYLKLRPYNSNGWVKAGLILLKKGQHDLAIKYLLQVLKFDKNNIEAQSYLCQAYLQTDQIKQAERQYGEILLTDQKNNFLNFIQPQMKN